MKSKLFKKYFLTTSLIILFSVTFMLLILSVAVTNYLAVDKYRLLEDNCASVSKIAVSDKTFTAHTGDLLFVNPLEVHSITVNKGGGPYTHHCICFDTSLIADKNLSKDLLDSKFYLENFFPTGHPLTEELIKHFVTLFYAVKTDSKTLVFDSNICISKIFTQLIRQNKLLKNSTKPR